MRAVISLTKNLFKILTVASEMYIIAIDVGIKNLAFICYNVKTREIDCWDNVTICGDDKYMPYNNVDYMYTFVAKYDNYFNHAIKVIIERQMRANMRIIESILHTMFFPICTIISAKEVKMHYDLSTRNYRQNKKAAVEYIAAQLETQEACISNHTYCLERLSTHTKKDDMADAMLLLLFYLQTHNVTLDL